MKKVICVYDGITDEDEVSIRLTIGKIYDVIEMRIDISGTIIDGPILGIYITIKDNIGDKVTYLMDNGNQTWFKDATPYLREDKLKQLGI